MAVLDGRLLDHDDSVNERHPGSKLCNSQEVTEKLWKETFDESFCQPGSMFRGAPPNGKLLGIGYGDAIFFFNKRIRNLSMDDILFNIRKKEHVTFV